jgi:hypothetical protein
MHPRDAYSLFAHLFDDVNAAYERYIAERERLEVAESATQETFSNGTTEPITTKNGKESTV